MPPRNLHGFDPDDERLSVRPTLFIGLGGTGREVLLRLRRKLLQREWNGRLLHSLDELPLVSFLAYDTARDGWRSDDAAAWHAEEIVIGREIEPRTLANNPALEAWFPHGDWTDHLNFPTRPTARATFLNVRDQIESALRTKLRHVDAFAQRGTYLRPDIRIVTSAAGSTGSAVMFDMGYLAKLAGRAVLGDQRGDVSLSLALADLLPPEYGMTLDLRAAHTYAALAELEYAMKLPEQDDDWRPDGSLSQRPFDWVHLLEGANTAGHEVGNPDGFAVMADILLHAVCERDLAQGVNANAEHGLRRPEDDRCQHGAAQWSRRTAGLGCAVIESRAHRDLRLRTFEGVCTMLHQAVLGDGDPPRELDALLAAIATPRSEDIIRYIVAPQRPDAPVFQVKTVEELLADPAIAELIPLRFRDAVAASTDLRDNPSFDKALLLCAQLQAGIEPRPHDEDEFARHIATVLRRNLSVEALNPTLDSAFAIGGLAGVTLALDTARAACHDTNSNARKLAQHWRKRSAQIRGYTLAPDLDKLMKILSGPRWLAALRRRKIRRLIQALSAEVQDLAKVWGGAIVAEVLCERCEKLAEEIGETRHGDDGRPYGTGLHHELATAQAVVRRTLGPLSQRCADMDREIMSPGVPQFLVGDRHTILDRFTDEMCQEARRILRESHSPWRFDPRDGDRLQTLVEDFHAAAGEVFKRHGLAPDTLPDMASVLDALPPEEIDTLADKVAAAAMPWLRLVPSPLEGLPLEPWRFKPTLRYSGTAGPFTQRLNQAIYRRALGVVDGTRYGYECSAEPPVTFGRMVVMSELAGLPIDTLALLKSWRAAYEKWNAARRVPLHIHKDTARFDLPL